MDEGIVCRTSYNTDFLRVLADCRAFRTTWCHNSPMRIPNILERAEFRSGKMGKCDLVQGEMLSAGMNCFEGGQEHKAHVHEGQDKLYYVLEGSGLLTIGGERSHFQAGDLALAPAGVEHSLRNDGPDKLVVLVVFAPPPRTS